jgi:hypothetical protein
MPPTRPFNGIFPVRGFASGKIHLAKCRDDQVYDIVAFGQPCFGGTTGTISLCGTHVGRDRGYVVMESTAAGKACAPCRRLAAE